MKKKFIAVFLVLATMLTLLAGCGSKATTAEKGTDGAAAPEEITMAFCSFNTLPSDYAHVEEAINAIIEKEYNVRVKLEVYSVANYTEQMSLRISGNDTSLGLIQTLGNLNQYVSKNMVLPLNELLEKYGAGIKGVVPADFLNCTTVNGELYAIPSNKGVAFAPCLVYRSDMMEQIGVDPSTITSINDLDALFATVQEKLPGVTPIAPANAGDIGTLDTITDMDFLTDDLFTAKGVLFGDSMQVVNLYSSDIFRELIYIARDWYNKGYIAKDAATSTTLASESMGAGQAFSYIALYSGDPAGATTQLSNMIGTKVEAVRIGSPYVSSSNVNAVSWCIPVSCAHPEAAMKFLNLLYSDRQILNMVLYGVEGVDHVKLDEDHIGFPEGKNAQTVSYCPMSSAMVGNQFNAFLFEGQSVDNLKMMEEENRTGYRSKAFGFTFDSSSVKTQYAAVSNVLNQYLPGLRCGSIDPETGIDEFVKALNDAGIQDIIDAKQKQLDAWVAGK